MNWLMRIFCSHMSIRQLQNGDQQCDGCKKVWKRK